MSKNIYGDFNSNCNNLTFSDLELNIKLLNNIFVELDRNPKKEVALDRLDGILKMIEIKESRLKTS